MKTPLDETLRDARRVLFLCTGNMVRSTFADLYARHLRCPLPVRSAATDCRNDRLPSATARALEARGVPATWSRDFRPAHLSDLLDELDELDERVPVFVMTKKHLESLGTRPQLLSRSFLLANLVGLPVDIRDRSWAPTSS